MSAYEYQPLPPVIDGITTTEDDQACDLELWKMGMGGEPLVYKPRLQRMQALRVEGRGPGGWLDRWLAKQKRTRRRVA